MSYIGNNLENQNYVPAIDYFNGDGSTTAFTLSRPVASVAAVQAVISNVPQNPGSAFSVSGSTITFTSAPPSGTANIYVYYTSPNTSVATLAQNPVVTGDLATTGGVYARGAFNSGYTDGVVVDYTSGLGRVTVGASDATAFYYGGTSSRTETMRIDSSGNVGIGTSSPSSGGAGYSSLTVSNSIGGQVTWNTGTSIKGFAYNDATNMYWGATNAYVVYAGGSERMRILSTGNVGINTATPSSKLNIDLGGVSTLGQQSNEGLAITGGGSNGNYCQIGFGYGTGTTYTPTAIGSVTTTQTGYTIADLVFATRSANTDTAPSERMRIDSSGRVLVGNNPNPDNPVDGIVLYYAYRNNQINIGHDTGASSGNAYGRFLYNGGVIGSITQNGTTAVAYNTSSDYRLKENIQPMQGALAVVQQLNPVTYTWKADGSDGQGFIAHELQAVVPDCVTGEKDAVDAEGKPVYQGIDTSFLVATLTAAIQELNAKVDAQAAEIAALKGQA